MEQQSKLTPSQAIHPGEILRDELKSRGIKQKDFAKMMDMQSSHLNEFIKGKRNINESMAIKLEECLQIPYSFWMNLQNSYFYDLEVIAKRSQKEQLSCEYEKQCNMMFNLKLLYKYLNISIGNIVNRVSKLKDIFEGDAIKLITELQVSGRYKHSEKAVIDEKNMNTWLLLNWYAISNIQIPFIYTQGNAVKAAFDVAKMANENKASISNIKKCLNKYGIAYVEVNKLDKAPIDAYSTIKRGTPVISVTYRYDDIDKLAFDILHELCHIDRHIKSSNDSFISIEGSEYSKDSREVEANEFARKMLIPDDVWKQIIQIQCFDVSPYAIVKLVAHKAQQLGISPTIAVARYKHEANWYKTNEYKSPKISDRM